MSGKTAPTSIDLGPERTFLTPRLDAARKFLTSLELERGGWPRYKGGPISIYHTSLVVSALSLIANDQHTVQVARAALQARSEFGDSLQTLEMIDLAHLAQILQTDSEVDRPLLDAVDQELRSRLENQLAQPSGLNVRHFSTAVAAVRAAGGVDESIVTKCAEHLLTLEKTENGGWPGAPMGEVSPLATADVIKALQTIDASEYLNPVQRGTRFLDNIVSDGGWQRVEGELGVFAQATLLRALSTRGTAANVDIGVATLEARANRDGGWGAGPNEPSTVEVTATALHALLECGEMRFVPYRTAATSLAAASRQSAKLEAELSEATRELNDRVSTQSKQILEDRNALRRENERLKKEREKLQLEFQELQRAAFEEARRSRYIESYASRDYVSFDPLSTVLRLVERVFPLLIITTAPVLLWLLAGSEWWVRALVWGQMFIGLGWVTTSTFHQYVLTRRRLRTISRVESKSSVSDVVLAYADIVSELPPSLREELTYTIATRIAEMPPSVGLDYLTNALQAMEVPRAMRNRLLSWVTRFLDLGSVGRRAVVDQIRRSLLIP